MTTIKICGITCLADAQAAVEAGADTLGFNFYPRSARCIEPEACARITAVVRAEHPSIRLVGVFVNATADEIRAILGSCGLDLAQLHGDEPPEMLAQLAPLAFKAFRGVPDHVEEYLQRSEAPACLVDAAVQGVYGGSGVAADWEKAERIARRYPIFLAGGLNPENAADAMRQVRPWGVDVASGVESAPGVKDAAKMRAFVQAVRYVTISGQDRSIDEWEKV
jgi:phosphoribosylanthranilate isomerase